MNAFPDSVTEKIAPDLYMILVLQKLPRHSRNYLFPLGWSNRKDLQIKITKIISGEN